MEILEPAWDMSVSMHIAGRRSPRESGEEDHNLQQEGEGSSSLRRVDSDPKTLSSDAIPSPKEEGFRRVTRGREE